MKTKNPLLYVGLIATLLFSAGPLYFMLVMASRTNDEIVSLPPPFWSAATSSRTSTGCSPTRTCCSARRSSTA